MAASKPQVMQAQLVTDADVNDAQMTVRLLLLNAEGDVITEIPDVTAINTAIADLTSRVEALETPSAG